MTREMKKGSKALRRALATADAARLFEKIPLITDETKLVTPEWAQQVLTHSNKCNRPVNWNRVEAYAIAMAEGKWVLTAQGLIFDTQGNLLTGQNRLWGVVYSGVSVHMRVSTGTPPEAGRLLDRGAPQTARDLASRETERKHSPTEASIARAICALRGHTRPSIDLLGEILADSAERIATVLKESAGTKKTRSVMIVLAAICETTGSTTTRVRQVDRLAGQLDAALAPQSAHSCWARGAAFSLAAETARKLVQGVKVS